MDAQLIELVGRQRLITELLQAEPRSGAPEMQIEEIDLIVYAELLVSGFKADSSADESCESTSCFAVDQKVQRVPQPAARLCLVYSIPQRQASGHTALD